MQRALLVLSLGVAATPAGARLTSDDDILLPDVDTLMGSAEDSVKAFDEEAGSMRQEVQENQRKAQRKLSALREEMEENLTLLDVMIGNARDENNKTQGHIHALEGRNDDLMAEARRWRASNNFLRESLTSLQARMQAAHEFLRDSLLESDVQGAPELAVLQHSTTPPLTVENFLRFVSDKDTMGDDRKVSLLSTGRERSIPVRVVERGVEARRPVEVVIPELNRSFQALEEAGFEGEAQLKGQYTALREWGERRLDEVRAKGMELAGKENELLKLGGNLNSAILGLKDRNSHLLRLFDGMLRFANHSIHNNGEAMKHASQAMDDAMKHAAALRGNPTA